MFPASVAESLIDSSSLAFQSRPTTGARRRSTRNGSSISGGGLLERARGLREGEIDIDPDDDKFAAQLGSIKWGVDSRGRIKIESKDDMRKRGLQSPDRAETAAMLFSGPAHGRPVDVESRAGESITGDLMTKAW